MLSQVTVDGFRFVLRTDRNECSHAVERVRDAGYPIPFSSVPEWGDYTARTSWYLEVGRPDGTPCGGTAVQVLSSRALPGFRILRVERLGANVAPEAVAATFTALQQIARFAPRILRLDIETFSTATASFLLFRSAAERAGVTPVVTPREYAKTLLIDVSDDVEALFKSIHATARRHIRAAEKRGLEIRPITELTCGPHLDALLHETLERTGGGPETHDWPAVLRYSLDFPRRSRVVGLFAAEYENGERPLAYAWGCHHGDHVHYSTAASTRHASIRVPMGYALAWDLITWAHATGARFFDFGGITEGSYGSDDPVGGISDFKRYFGGQVVECGQDWNFVPSRTAASAARVLSRMGRALSRSGAPARRAPLAATTCS